MLTFKKILCPTDFSEPSSESLKMASDLAIQFDAELCILHVMEPQEPVLGIISTEEFDKSRIDDAMGGIYRQVDQVVDENVRARPLVRTGDTATEILQAARDEQSDLIVIATHGLTGWRHLVFGSVAEVVVNQSATPVMTIHEPPHQNSDSSLH